MALGMALQSHSLSVLFLLRPYEMVSRKSSVVVRIRTTARVIPREASGIQSPHVGVACDRISINLVSMTHCLSLKPDDSLRTTPPATPSKNFGRHARQYRQRPDISRILARPWGRWLRHRITSPGNRHPPPHPIRSRIPARDSPAGFRNLSIRSKTRSKQTSERISQP